MRHNSMRPLVCLICSLFAGVTASFNAQSADPAQLSDQTTQPADAPAPSDIQEIVITAKHFEDARIGPSAKIGTTVYSVDHDLIDSLGQGDASGLDEVLLRLPGVDKDSKSSGSLHVRDEHGNVQYRVDGVQLPENISGFGLAMDTRVISKIDFMTGALPAQFGLHTAGVVDIQTKNGMADQGGNIGVTFGSHNTFEPSAAFFGSRGRFSYYLSGSYTSNNIGIENPQPTYSPMHDQTEQTKSFGKLSYDLDSETRFGLIFGTYNGKYQIPVNPNQAVGYSLAGFSDTATGATTRPSSAVDENQTEANRFVSLSLQTLGDLSYQLSLFHQYSSLHFTPDPIGDLIFNGVASDSLRSNSATGLQFDASYKLNPDHTLRFGTAYTRQNTQSDNTVAVFPADGSGVQTPGANLPVSVIDNSSQLGRLTSYYGQDEWHIGSRLTVNYGMRFDHVEAFTNEQQWSPRINTLYALTDATSVHAGFSRYFTPPPQELASQKSINLYADTTNQPLVPYSDNVKAERTNYFDLGISHKLTPELTLAADSYYKDITDLIDEGQFGQALILSPFNYDKGYAQGLELSASYSAGPWSAYLNAAYQKAQGKDIVSGQALFAPAELAYIANHYTYLDHDQTDTLSGGASYKFGQNQLSGDFLFGSGLRRTPASGVPNGAALPSYAVFNTTLTHTWDKSSIGTVEGRVAILNLFDETYLLRDGTGVGVSAPQYGMRRTIYFGLSTSF